MSEPLGGAEDVIDPALEAALVRLIAGSEPPPQEQAETKRLLDAKTFDRRRDNPELWAGWARSHRLAADLLLNSPPPNTFLPQALMLYGYAVENLLKGLYVLSKPRLTPGGLGSLKSHHLISLAQFCGLTLTNEESALLEKLREVVLWQGRYPLSTSPAGTPEWYLMGTTEQIGAERLFDRLMSELQRRSAGLQGPTRPS